MASISSLMGNSSSTSSIYGSRNTNIISGLASGMDTEAMIEGMVQGYQQKIISLQQDRTKLQWQQEAYQSISDKLIEFSRKYTSYSSTTNLLSNTFFNNAVIASANGKYADMVSASGKSSSEIILNGVKQLASAARYSQTASSLGAKGDSAVGGSVNLSEQITLSKMSGTMDITYGTQKISLEFAETEDFSKADGTLDTEKFKKALEQKLSEQKLRNHDGDRVKASQLIDVQVDSDGNVTLTNKDTGGDSVYLSGASGDLAGFIASAEEDGTFQVKTDLQVADQYASKAEYLDGKTFSVTLNGQTKKITLDVRSEDGSGNEAVAKALQRGLDDAFGSGKIKVGAEDGKFSFTSQTEGNTFSIEAEEAGVGEVLFGKGNESLTSYLDVSKTLGQLGSFNAASGMLVFGDKELQGTAIKVDKSEWVEQEDGTYTDLEGNALDSEGYRINSDGERLYEYELNINGKKVGSFTQDTALETVLNSINSNLDAGVNVSYSKLTNEFVFTAKDTGAAGKIEMGDGLAQALFGKSDKYTKGTDAKFIATVNGRQTTFTRSTNSVNLDGLTIKLEGTFNVSDSGELIDKSEKVTFTSETDTDTLVDAIKQMVEDYNAIVTEVKKAFSDMPLQQSNGSRYEPLTSDDEADMTESEIEAYEEKAKTGILFMDQDLSSLYNSLRSAVVPGGDEGSYLRSIGIKTSYDNGLTTISLDETALREALENDLDGVKDAFTKSKEYGSATDGLMTSIQNTIEKYASDTGATKGILVEKAGSQYVPTAALDNTLLNKMEDIDEQISKWQDKMSNKVDYYTNKFTQLEMLINQMNSQSSALAGLTG